VLIVDVGLHRGQDTAYYLSRGASVVSIDADPRMIEQARTTFAEAVAAQRLNLINAAVGVATGTIPFHLSENGEWSSLSTDIATRKQLGMTTIDVPAVRLPDVFQSYGTPDYCKIDVEGADLLCLQSLEAFASPPRFISVESECAGDTRLTDEEALRTLHALHGLGYRQFKLVDQATLTVLSPDTRFYAPSVWQRAVRKVQPQPDSRDVLEQRLQWKFEVGASGPFGEDLDGGWMPFQTAVSTLTAHRRDYFRQPSASPFGFWCDWHATR
jgi:FkbM family methyltransferase